MTDKHHTDTDRITTNPAIMVGKAVVKGTWIPVERVLAHMANNLDLQETSLHPNDFSNDCPYMLYLSE